MKKILIAGGAALLIATSAARATVDEYPRMPDSLRGEWCHLTGGDEQNPHQQIFVRATSSQECHGGDNGITVDETGWGGEGSCAPEKIEQTAANTYLIEANCDEGEGEHGRVTFELVGDTLIMTWLSES
jgi:hypothetical protein